jgi:hypothetical protein
VRNSILIFLAVAALSSWIARTERVTRTAAVAAPGVSPSADDWVRTADGWERRAALMAAPPAVAVKLHPGLFAALQVGVSLLALAVFPGRARPIRPAAPAPATARRAASRRIAEHVASH